MFPIIAYIGDMPLRTYYVINALGIIAGFITLLFFIKGLAPGMRKKTIIFAALIFIPFLLGGRLGSIIETALSGRPQCASVFNIFGPSSLWWGLVLATLLAFPIAAVLKTNVWETADIFAPSIAIGGFFARLACFSAGCCFGVPCPENTAGAIFTSISPAGRQFGDTLLYPAQLYESAAWLAIFVILVARRKFRGFHGESIIILAIVYSVARFFIEFIRYHKEPAILSIAQIWSIIIFIIAVFVVFMFKKHGINRISPRCKI